MDKTELEIQAEKEFPLPKKEDYVGGEAFIWETEIIKQRQQDFIKGGMFVLENIIPVK